MYLWLLLFCLGANGREREPNPLFFELSLEQKGKLNISKVGEIEEDGFIFPVAIDLVSDNKRPLYYQSEIQTTVCDDEICEILYIQMFWDLVGKYIGFDTLPGHQLTKFDHKPFLENDYQKLHALLLNESSILKFKTKSELIDKDRVKASDVVDGTTGATSLEIKEEVVEGALYSSYTLWHLAYNGKVENLVKARSKLHLENGLLQTFLTSGRENYRLFAFQSFSENDYHTYTKYWLDALKNDIPLTRKLIIRNIPESLWKSFKVQEKICSIFSDFDVNTRTYLLNKIEDLEERSIASLEGLSEYSTLMNKNQLLLYLSLIKTDRINTYSIEKNIKKASEEPSFKYAYLIKDYKF